MTRFTQQVSLGVAIAAVYLAALFDYIPAIPAIIKTEILPVLPLWAIVTFGAYLLSRVGIALLLFNDVPQAYETLAKEIEQAKAELRTKGVDVD